LNILPPCCHHISAANLRSLFVKKDETESLTLDGFQLGPFIFKKLNQKPNLFKTEPKDNLLKIK
jgi:hypothetical protein